MSVVILEVFQQSVNLHYVILLDIILLIAILLIVILEKSYSETENNGVILHYVILLDIILLNAILLIVILEKSYSQTENDGVILQRVILLSIFMLHVILLSVILMIICIWYSECCSIECYLVECRIAKFLNSDSHSEKCHSTECHSIYITIQSSGINFIKLFYHNLCPQRCNLSQNVKQFADKTVNYNNKKVLCNWPLISRSMIKHRMKIKYPDGK